MQVYLIIYFKFKNYLGSLGGFISFKMLINGFHQPNDRFNAI